MMVSGERRRRTREQEAQAMQQLDSDSAHHNWDLPRPMLDEAIHKLREQDREALLLRFYHRREPRAADLH